MSRHHPKNETLAEFAAGTLDEGRSLVVAAHMAMCGACRGVVAAFEAVGGQMLCEIEPVAMSDGAAARALAALDDESPRAAQAKPAVRPVWQSEQQTLLGYDLGPWRWVAPGLHYRAVKTPDVAGTRVFMLKAVPGLKIPQHNHTGTELTCVLQGAFIHEGGRYGPGDCDDADQDDSHNPVIDEGQVCVCLVAMQGDIRMTGVIGRMIQPFIRL
ncbi:MAG: ChrR family anti-sigma-E factor [Pseudolabrys sp.]|nr:ChrR family anti-sigma-E factor [Pseudolabrys sp.]